jgi:serine/threonine protein kinase
MLKRPHIVKRFHAEFRAARKLFHPNLVRALDFGVDQGVAYLALEYVAGRSLFEMMREKLRLSEAEAAPIYRQTAQGLLVAHQLNIVHRDIKPANILIAEDGVVKVSDLGLAKDLLSDEALTRSGASLGTLQYMAPEQFMNARRADHRSDIYSLGVTFYHVLTGRLPFTGGQLTMLQKKLKNDVVPPRDIMPNLSAAMNQLLMQSLRADPDDRPATVSDVLSRLDSTDRASSSAIIALKADSALTPDNRRADDRFAADLSGSCSILMGPSREAYRGQVIDISAGGAHLRVPRRFEVGSIVIVDIADEQIDEPISFMIRVAWIRPADGDWRIGGRFHRRLPPSELQRLLHRELQTVVLHES